MVWEWGAMSHVSTEVLPSVGSGQKRLGGRLDAPDCLHPWPGSLHLHFPPVLARCCKAWPCSHAVNASQARQHAVLVWRVASTASRPASQQARALTSSAPPARAQCRMSMGRITRVLPSPWIKPKQGAEEQGGGLGI